MRTLHYPPTHPPGDGPWKDEPEKIQWIDPDTDLDCLIVRGPSGSLCGYVGVQPGHPWYGKDYDDVDVDVHGGLTFAHSCATGPDGEELDDADGPAICHVPEPGRPHDVWWLGFDCAHWGDISPGMDSHLRNLGIEPFADERCTYKTVEYVTGECASLARQVLQAT